MYIQMLLMCLSIRFNLSVLSTSMAVVQVPVPERLARPAFHGAAVGRHSLGGVGGGGNGGVVGVVVGGLFCLLASSSSFGFSRRLEQAVETPPSAVYSSSNEVDILDCASGDF